MIKRLLCFLLFYVIYPILSYSQETDVHFMHFTRESGFIGKTVNSIMQDSRNFIWFATDVGLNRFDGYGFKVFKTDLHDIGSISSSAVNALYEDQDNVLWIGTESGLNVFERDKETFKKYYSVDSLYNTLSYNYIKHIIEDKSGNIIIGTGGGGICLYNKESDDFTRLVVQNNTDVKFGKFINCLESLPDGNILTITDGNNLHVVETKGWKAIYSMKIPDVAYGTMMYGENAYIGLSDKFLIFNVYEKIIREINLPKQAGISRGVVSTFEVDGLGVIWIGTTNNGLYLFKPSINKIINNFTHNEFNSSSINCQGISKLFIDKTGKLWIGTWGSGLNYYHSDIIKFKLFQNSASATNNLPGNKVNVLYEDSKLNIWIGTESGLGIYSIKEGKLKLQRLLGSTQQITSPVLSVFEDQSGQVWIGTYLEGLHKFNPKTNTIVGVLSNSNYSIQDIIEPFPGILWLGTMQNGVMEYDTRTGMINKKEIPGISITYILKLLIDDYNNIWMGTAYGLYKYNPLSGTVVHYLNEPTNPHSISNNHIYGLLKDDNGLLYVATSNGLNIYSYDTDSFTKIGQEQGLQEEFILSLEIDSSGRVWASTLNGLSSIQIDADNKNVLSIVNYSSFDGVQNAEFRENSSVHLVSGELMFGGNMGVNYFMPESIRSSSFSQEAIITNMLLYNNEIEPQTEFKGRVILDKAITETEAVTLKHYENVLSFKFSALNSIIPQKCQYKYKLQGFDQEWIIVGASQRKANYTNLDAGEYTFMVKASNSDGVWSDYTDTLNIRVLPPIWKTKWALLIYAFILFVLLLALRQLIILNERKQSHEKLAIQEAKRQLEIDNLKIRFFTNISHEFRTPLTLIITPLEKILKESRHKDIEQALQTIYRNSRSLLNLVNQLLDFRKMEVSGIKLQVSTGDIINFLKEMVTSFCDLAEKKNISYKFRANVNEMIMDFDHDKVEKIIFNLLSNAFKYTLEKGDIKVEVDLIEQFNLVAGKSDESNKHEIQVKVKDNGIGIPQSKLESIFERFTQAETSDKMVEHGSGIGLSLTREFVKLHGGTISVDSEEGKGSCFTFSIPVHQNGTELVEKEEPVDDTFTQLAKNEHEKKILNDSTKKTLVIVEDSEDLRFYLRENLQLEYNIHEAPNGKIGFEKIKKILPDIIITDIMMPEVDGMEMCKLVKGIPETSHIPIIMLTAKTSDEQKVAGYGCGVDAFLTKPFSFEVLEMRIKNLVEQRNKLRQIFHKKIDVNPSEISVTSIDEKLIKKALEIVEKNMSNADFTVEQLGRDLGMSRVHLYKKLLSITGKSPIEFIRILRLKRAAQLLQKSQMRISEIAYEVGFNNPKYFSKYFKEQFKMLPSEYAQKHNLPSPNHSID